MDVDISKLSYLSDSVDFKTIESIESCIGSTWEMTLDNPLQEVLDCKIISARWVSDQSAIDVLKCEPNDLSDYKILEVKYSVWMTTHVASYEIINRITNIEYPYVNEYDDLTDPKSYYIIHDIEIESIEGNIEHTKLPEEGILKLLDSLEYGKLSGDLPYIEPEELPDNLHP